MKLISKLVSLISEFQVQWELFFQKIMWPAIEVDN